MLRVLTAALGCMACLVALRNVGYADTADSPWVDMNVLVLAATDATARQMGFIVPLDVHPGQVSYTMFPQEFEQIRATVYQFQQQGQATVLGEMSSVVQNQQATGYMMTLKQRSPERSGVWFEMTPQADEGGRVTLGLTTLVNAPTPDGAGRMQVDSGMRVADGCVIGLGHLLSPGQFDQVTPDLMKHPQLGKLAELRAADPNVNLYAIVAPRIVNASD